MSDCANELVRSALPTLSQPPYIYPPSATTVRVASDLRPAPMDRRRDSMPSALNALVTRCLETRPVDRVQRADQLLAPLESIATSGAGLALTHADPAISNLELAALTADAEATLRRRHPIRVTALPARHRLPGNRCAINF